MSFKLWFRYTYRDDGNETFFTVISCDLCVFLFRVGIFGNIRCHRTCQSCSKTCFMCTTICCFDVVDKGERLLRVSITIHNCDVYFNVICFTLEKLGCRECYFTVHIFYKLLDTSSKVKELFCVITFISKVNSDFRVQVTKFLEALHQYFFLEGHCFSKDAVIWPKFYFGTMFVGSVSSFKYGSRDAGLEVLCMYFFVFKYC